MASVVRSPLRHLDVEAISAAAAAETRRRESHLPPVSVFRWWARRTESVVGSVIDATSIHRPGRMTIADPFAGGGTIALAAAMRGHRVYAQDINPWAVRGVATSMTLPAPSRIEKAIEALAERMEQLMGKAYEVDGVTVLRTMRVKTGHCPNCGTEICLYPTGLVSLEQRVDRGGSTGLLACPAGHLFRGEATGRRRCPECRRMSDPDARYTAGGEVTCYSCRQKAPTPSLERASWVPVIVEVLEGDHRAVRLVTRQEAQRAESPSWRPQRSLGPIPEGAETRRLLLHGYRKWEDLYPRRQRVVIEALLAAIPEVAGGDDILANALETALIGVAEFPGYLSRWDARYLKPYEAIANHRFQPTTFAVEPHVWGVGKLGRGTALARLKALAKAAQWSEDKLGGRIVRIRQAPRKAQLTADTTLLTASAHCLGVPDRSLDLVLTDPPYHDDVQYAELAWLYQSWNGGIRRLEGDLTVGPHGTSTASYRHEMTKVFKEVRRALKDDGHLILSYANRNPEAWIALVGALHDAGFQAVGVASVLAENESDHSKANRRAATYDLLVDVVPATGKSIEKHRAVTDATDQGRFLHLVSEWVLQIGELPQGWEEQMTAQLKDSEFLK